MNSLQACFAVRVLARERLPLLHPLPRLHNQTRTEVCCISLARKSGAIQRARIRRCLIHQPRQQQATSVKRLVIFRCLGNDVHQRWSRSQRELRRDRSRHFIESIECRRSRSVSAQLLRNTGGRQPDPRHTSGAGGRGEQPEAGLTQHWQAAPEAPEAREARARAAPAAAPALWYRRAGDIMTPLPNGREFMLCP
eukprot:COSAG02_NODE_2555_length_8532_cov_7.259900_4_plen_195_part_00